jgi:hypothetical protein
MIVVQVCSAIGFFGYFCGVAFQIPLRFSFDKGKQHHLKKLLK